MYPIDPRKFGNQVTVRTSVRLSTPYISNVTFTISTWKMTIYSLSVM